MPVTRDEVIWAYRYVLGRDPEDEAAIETHQRVRDVATLRRSLLMAAEFSRAYLDLPQRLERADPSLAGRPKRVFLHLPKCAGTTLHHLLTAAAPEAEQCPERHNGLYNWPVGRLAGYTLFSGHFDLPSIALLSGEKRIVTMLREPRVRLASVYRFLKAHRIGTPGSSELSALARHHSFGDFLAHPALERHASINNAMTRALAGPLPTRRWDSLRPDHNAPNPVDRNPAAALALAKQVLSGFAAVGTAERFDESMRAIFRAFDLPEPAAVYESRQVLSVISAEHPWLERIDGEADLPPDHPAITAHVSLDDELYKFATGVLAR